MAGTLGREVISTRQCKIAELARREPKLTLTTLAHHVDEQWMREAYRRVRKDAAAGVDGVTAAQYEADLEANLSGLLERFKSGRYRAPAVRRVHLEKPGTSKTRPIGIPTLEDKVLQRAVLMVMEPVYEQEFMECSYGFRPGRGAHQALEALWRGLMEFGGGWVIDLDIEDFFGSVDRGHLGSFLDRRVRDGVIRRAIVLGVSPSGFYAWCRPGRSAREESDEALSARVRAIHQRSRGTYGAPRIRAELAAEGTPVSRKRVARFRSLRELALKFRSLRELAWCSMRWIWRWDNDARPRSSITPTKAASTPRSPSVNAAANGAWRRRWARWGTATTTRWRRASSQRSNASCSTAPGSRTITRHKGRSSSTSKDGITRTVVTKDWVTSPPSTSRGATSKPHDTQAINRPLKWGNSRSSSAPVSLQFPYKIITCKLDLSIGGDRVR